MTFLRVSEAVLRKLFRLPHSFAEFTLTRLFSLSFLAETKETQTPITFDMWFRQKVIGMNCGPYWPVHPSSCVVGWRNILAGVETSPGYMPGCYIQAIGRIIIGDYTQIGPSVGLISANHIAEDLSAHEQGSIQIGRYCWIGFGAVILPGVTLGDFTTVGANAVVTKSFSQGYCVIAGNPATVIRELNPAICIEKVSPHEYQGFIPKAQFEDFRRANLNV